MPHLSLVLVGQHILVPVVNTEVSAKEFDRTDRYDKSLLRLGHLWIRELIKRANQAMRQQSRVEAARLANCLPFHLVEMKR